MGGQSNSWQSIYHHYAPWSMQTRRNVLAEENLSFWLAIITRNTKTGIRELNSSIGILLREFASANFYIVHGSDVSTTIPSCPIVIVNVVVKDFVLPVNLTALHLVQITFMAVNI